jgi:polysaccharide deacetylase 2 family uncharacterized protein YibQ
VHALGRRRLLAAVVCLVVAISALAVQRVVSADLGGLAGRSGTPDLALAFQRDRAAPVPRGEDPPAPRRHAQMLQAAIPASLFMSTAVPDAATSATPDATAPVASVPAIAAMVTPRLISGPPPWLRYAVPAAPATGPVVAIVLDDFGLDRANAFRTLTLPGPLTLSIMTYARQPQALAAAVRRAGHEVMLHMPMEALGAGEDPGPQALLTSLDPAEIGARARWGLDRFDGYVGVNNHMGSRFTASERAMLPLMQELKARGLLFLDSMTTPRSVGARLAHELGVPYLRRDIFLDNVPNVTTVEGQLDKLEALARRRGYAVGIGHPRPATIAALAAWLPVARARGITLVPLSAIARRENAPLMLAQSAAAPSGKASQ